MKHLNIGTVGIPFAFSHFFDLRSGDLTIFSNSLILFKISSISVSGNADIFSISFLTSLKEILISTLFSFVFVICTIGTLAKYNGIFEDFGKDIPTSGKACAVGSALNYRPELNAIKEKLELIIATDKENYFLLCYITK